jgi:hypothetical protein
MTGKVFVDSANVYQDQAKVLLDYYKKASEKIISEETALEKQKAEAQADSEKAAKKQKLGLILLCACGVVGVLFFIIGIVSENGFLDFLGIAGLAGTITGLVFMIKGKKAVKTDTDKITAFEQAYADIRRDYKISKLGVVYVPVATRVPFEQKSFLVDHTGSVNDTNFALTLLHQPDEFKKSLEELENGMQSIPVVEKNEQPEEIDTAEYSTSIQNVTLHDYLGNIDRQVRNISYLLGDSENVSVDLPVIKPESQEDQFIKDYTTTDTNGKPVVPVFNIDNFGDKLEKFASLNSMKHQIEASGESDNTEYFKNLMVQLAQSVQILSKTKTASTNKLIDYTSKIFSTVLKASFNQYSPVLEAEEIERIRTASFDYQDEVNDYTPFTLKASSRVKYDIMAGTWIAEDGSRTSMPFGMHQINEEVLMPVINNLMQENRVERLKIYNGIKDQKIDYLNQWHRDTEDFFGRNRTEANGLIQHMHDTFADYSSAYNTYKALQETQASMKNSGSLDETETHERNNDAEVIAGFEAQAQQCNAKQQEFSEFMDRIKDDIDQSAEKFGHIEYYEASLRDTESRDVARSVENIQQLDDRRKKLVAISSYFAKYAQLPPEPTTTDQLMDDFSLNLEQTAADNVAMLNQAAEDLDAAAKKAEAESTAAQPAAPVAESKSDEEMSDDDDNENKPEV